MRVTLKNAPAKSLPPDADLITRLCSNCGMCCNGALFADVRVTAGDEAGRLRRLGIELRGRTRLRMSQPCPCFDGKFCGIYTGRPVRCAQFECGVLKRVRSGKLSESVGQHRIAKARAKAERVRRWLRRSGENSDDLPLTKRYARAMARPLDLHREHDAAARGKLMRAMAHLMQFLHREFLS